MKRRDLIGAAAAAVAVSGLPRVRAQMVTPPAPTLAPGPSAFYRQGTRRASYPNYANITGQTNYRMAYRLDPPTGQDLVDPIVVEGNFAVGPPDADGLNTGYTIRACIEYPPGTVNLMYHNGSRDMVLAPGSILSWDPVGLTITGGTYARLHRRILVATTADNVASAAGGMSTISGIVEGSTSDQLATDNTSAPGASYSITGTQPSGTLPLLVIGRRQSLTGGMSSVAIVGDSIASGVGDTVGDQCGFMQRALGTARPWAMLSRSSMKAADWKTTSYRHVQLLSLGGFTHAICNMGINDVSTGPLATIQANLQFMWQLCVDRGIKVWQTTLTPHTTSTDSWATTANQTPTTNAGPGGIRTQLNDWIRTVPAPLSGYFEVDDVVSTGRNTGIWQVGSVYLTDALGIHPSPTGHAAMAAVLAPIVSAW